MERAAELRAQLHEMPEASLHEDRTRQVLLDFVDKETDFTAVDRGQWAYAWKKAERPDGRPPIAFRADMDAVCGKDGRPGHFCGHDGHSAILAGLAMELSRREGPLGRDVYLIFQPAEEIGKGAALCAGLLEEQGIGEIYGLHNIPGRPRGSVLLRDGTFACASTGLEIAMHGTPSHAAYPEAGRDPGPALARLLLDVQDLTKRIRETEGFVLMTLIGMDVGSDSYGVAASEGVLRLTVRGEREQLFQRYVAEIRHLAEDAARRDGLELELRAIEPFPATENHSANVERVRQCARDLGMPVIDLEEPMRWSEDFGIYLQKIPGAFFGIGDGEDYAQLHTAEFQFPDAVIAPAVDLFAALAR